MRATLNGVDRELPDRATVADAVTALGAPTTGVAVAVDGEVVPRAAWDRPLREHARVEVITAVQGG
ncbi:MULTISPECIES: sulfur carrier protein ThiS [Actinosynnema]|uniref:sulfur carrier protein ThiS n=1 Tax=Actinosynnema TaxID=40566 RepID=UPI0020A262A4|nr:sulfur carrier protein ThiS [Actinosynnema pretiosum]MCP2096810.1 sulfur carrier protein [Actinosynnema pretiosum]